MDLYKASFYHKEDSYVCCDLCPHGCRIEEGARGLCGVREVFGGELYSINYGLCAALAMDPIEKKPLYHFYPGKDILSLGTWGCNLKCEFCQNWRLARGKVPEEKATHFIKPEKIIELLKGKYSSSLGIAYTYNEPAVWYEYVCDTARLVRQNGFKNVLVTNGFISPEALGKLLPYVDALNLDVKSFRESFYRKYCQGGLSAVKKTVEYCAGKSHLEVTTLIIPGLNDSSEEIAELTDWLSGINPEIPVHFSRYFPQYKCSLPPTSTEKLLEIRSQALKKMKYVYIGNAGGLNGTANTFCPRCNNLLIRRNFYSVNIEGILKSKLCGNCGFQINITGDI